METLFFSAFGMSIAFAAQPGVITFESIRRGMARGWRAALFLEFGSLVGDATWALIALLGVSFLFEYELIALLFSFFGCGLLLYFAWESWRASRKDASAEQKSLGGSSDFLAGASLSLSNPQNISFWLGMSGTVISLGFLHPEPLHLGMFFSGFMTAQVFWAFFFAALVGCGRKVVNARFFHYVNLICAVVLAYLGITLLISTLKMAL